jgi:hypothetical protein
LSAWVLRGGWMVSVMIALQRVVLDNCPFSYARSTQPTRAAFIVRCLSVSIIRAELLPQHNDRPTLAFANLRALGLPLAVGAPKALRITAAFGNPLRSLSNDALHRWNLGLLRPQR